MVLFVNPFQIPSGWGGSVIKNLGFITLSNNTTIILKNIGEISVHITGLGNRNGLSEISFSVSKYLTHCPSEYDDNDTVYELPALITSGRFIKIDSIYAPVLIAVHILVK